MIIKINDTHKDVIIQALDFYSRTLAGQFTEIERLFWSKMQWENKNSIEAHLNILKKQIFPELQNGEYLGIMDDKLDEKARVAYDILQVIRYKAGSVFVDGSILHTSIQPLPEVLE